MCCLLDVSCLLGLKFGPSAPVFLLPQGFFDTREAGIRARSRACFSFSCSSIGFARDDICPVILGSLREMSLQALMKFEGSCNCFWFSHIPGVCFVLHHLFWVRLGALRKLRLFFFWLTTTIVVHDSTNFLKIFVVSCLIVKRHASFVAIVFSEVPLCPK